MRRILITGAAGALGRALANFLARSRTVEVYCVVRRVVVGLAGRQFQCDVRNAVCLADVVRNVRPHQILHLAASFTGSLEEVAAINVVPAHQMLDFIETNELEIRIVLIGSAAEYGRVRPEENPLREDRVLLPVSVYGLTKAWQTQLVSLYSARGVDVLGARIFNLVGPGISTNLLAGSLQRQIADALAMRARIIELGPLGAVRDYLTIDEAVQQLVDIADYGVAGETYHVASGVPISAADFVRTQVERHGLDMSIVRVSHATQAKAYDVPVIFANMDKTRLLQSKKVRNA